MNSILSKENIFHLVNMIRRVFLLTVLSRCVLHVVEAVDEISTSSSICAQGDKFFDEVAFTWYSCEVCGKKEGSAFAWECKKCCKVMTTMPSSTVTPLPSFKMVSPSQQQASTPSISKTRSPIKYHAQATFTSDLPSGYKSTLTRTFLNPSSEVSNKNASKSYTLGEKISTKRERLTKTEIILISGMVTAAVAILLTLVIKREMKNRRSQEADQEEHRLASRENETNPIQCTDPPSSSSYPMILNHSDTQETTV